MQTVGIIGGSGFIGSYITKIFLEENYKVRISSTDINNKGKYEHLETLNNAHNLEVCALDVCNVNMLEKFATGCNILVHAGTPFKLDVKDPQKELFDPTVQGTRNFLDVISKSKELKKVVIIASIASYNTSFPINPTGYSADHIFTEQDSTFMSDQDAPYALAKFLAAQEVKKFTNEHSNLSFEVSSISPTFVVGNSLSNLSRYAVFDKEQNSGESFC